ncbi:hypothetical protein [Streptomyces viridochromogenes]|uniref:hypothetical protein n=1 Tax=Streptomyces viridochromogenes TaxID=1938 RepID=UPI003F801728
MPRIAAVEADVQDLVEGHMEMMLGVRFLASEYVIDCVDGGRIDSLGLDENGAPVIVEYKRGTDAGVINQGLYYMAWLTNHKDAFRNLVRDRLGVTAASQPSAYARSTGLLVWSGWRARGWWSAGPARVVGAGRCRCVGAAPVACCQRVRTELMSARPRRAPTTSWNGVVAGSPAYVSMRRPVCSAVARRERRKALAPQCSTEPAGSVSRRSTSPGSLPSSSRPRKPRNEGQRKG